MMLRALFALLAALPLIANAATWYVDCSSGTNGAGTSFSVPFNTTSSLNWTTINTGNDDVLFKEGTTCTNAQLGGASGFPNALNIDGTSADKIRIGVYSAADGSEILAPTETQKPRLQGDGTTRTEMVSLFGFTHTVVNGFHCSGGSNASGRGCIALGANGATPSSEIDVTNNTIVQGATPTNTANMYGISVAGTSSGTTGATFRITGNRIAGLVGTSGAFGVRCINVDACIIADNVLGQNTASATGGVLFESSTDARAVTTGSTVTGNAITGNQYGIRYVPFGTSTTFARIVGANWSTNVLRGQALHGVYTNLLVASRVTGNTIDSAGSGAGLGSGVYFSAAAGFAGSTDAQGTAITGNTITGSGQFGVWVIGARNTKTSGNLIDGCGSVNVPNTFGRCIEYVRAGSITYPAQTLTLSATTGGAVTATAGGGSVFAATDIDKIILGPSENPGVCLITGFTSATVVTCNVLNAFNSTSLPSSRWPFGTIAAQGEISDNVIRNAYGRQYLTALGTEGIGIGLDDGTSLINVLRNRVENTDFAAIDLNGGHGNRIIGNYVIRGGLDPTQQLGPASVRHSGIKTGYTDAYVAHNTVDCGGNAYAITAENSTTASPTTPDAGGVVTAAENTMISCSRAGMVLNSNDSASRNSYFENALNFRTMAQLTFSSVPNETDLTTQTLDGASLTSNPLLTDGRPSSLSPLCGAGKIDPPIAGTYFGGARFGPRPAIGAFACPSIAQ